MFKNLTIRMQLIALIGFMSVLLIGLGTAGLLGVKKSNEELRALYENRTVPMNQLGEIRYLIASNRLAVESTLITSTEEYTKEQADRIEKNIGEITRLWNEYLSGSVTAEEKEFAQNVAQLRAKFVTEGLKPALAALRANDLGTAGTIAVEQMRPLAEPVSSGLDALMKLQLYRGKLAYEEAEARYRTSVMIGVGSIVAGVLIAVAIGLLLIRAITRPLREAVRIADAVAAGDLTMKIEPKSNNETGRLLQALKHMNDGLVDLVSKVRSGVDSITTGSQEIAAGNADLSQRTEEQASSLEETASSMEELTSTVKQTSDNARQANQLAAGASAVAVKGGEVVGQVVTTMSGISDSSKKIADIISVIDGIAFQTNILALNAAVEAARAGEQGRGFAVVASEVRTLAQRSAAAAREIKELITDSVRRVEDGTQLVDQAGKTMGEIVGAIKRVADIMADITAAALEQSSGIEQVNQAVMQMDQVTQQNAALVEEAAAAAESMQHQSQGLAQAVSVFKVAHSTHGVPAEARRNSASLEEQSAAPVNTAVERRGPNRAKNVSRLSAKGAPPASAEPTHSRTGTDDDWSEF